MKATSLYIHAHDDDAFESYTNSNRTIMWTFMWVDRTALHYSPCRPPQLKFGTGLPFPATCAHVMD